MFGSGYIKRAIRPQVHWGEGLLRTVLAVAVPTLLRWVIDRGTNGGPFLLYFPAIQMIATFLGWRWGAVTAAASAIAGTYFFIPPILAFPRWADAAVLLGLFGVAAGTMVLIGHLLRLSVLENAERARQNEEFNRELQHRTKNSLQMVRALAGQAAKATDPSDFYEKLGGRLGALAKANELLRFGALNSCEMGELVSSALAPFASEQIAMSGPSCHVAKQACTPLVMALHELGTNAHKYGSLSSPDGRVDVAWQLTDNRHIELSWVERGGPEVAEPTHKGLGSRLIAAQGQLKAVSIKYPPTGLTCTIRIAAEPAS